MSEGRKFDAKKLDLSLLPWESVREVVRVLQFGAVKYERDNWKNVTDTRRRYTNAILRHTIAYQQGEDKDQEWGLSHMGHAICSALFLLWFEMTGTAYPVEEKRDVEARSTKV